MKPNVNCRNVICRFAFAAVLAHSMGISSKGAAQDKTPDPRRWARRVMKNPKAWGGAAIPRKIAFLGSETSGGRLAFFGGKPGGMQSGGYFRLADPRSAEWDFVLNEEKLSGLDPLVATAKMTGAETIVRAPDGGPWGFFQKAKGSWARAYEAEGPSDPRDSAVVSSWVLNTLGWDGVVLAQRRHFVLVGATQKALSVPNIQALAVAGSESKLALPGDPEGAGLLALNKQSGPFAVFDVVFLADDAKNIPVGTKLILEKKKR